MSKTERTAEAVIAATLAAPASQALASGQHGLALEHVLLAAIGVIALGAARAVARSVADNGRQYAHAFVTRFARLRGTTRAAAQLELQQSAGDKKGGAAVFVTLRALLDVVPEDVATALGNLAGEYRAEGREPDSFLRSVVRVLTDLSSEELHDLQLVCATLTRKTGRRPFLHVATSPARPRSLRATAGGAIYTDDEPPRELTVYRAELATDAPRLMRLLILNGLAREGRSSLSTDEKGEKFGFHWEPNVVVERATLKRIATLLPSPGASEKVTRFSSP